MPNTFGQLLVELEGLKKSDPKLLEAPLRVDTAEGHANVELAITLPGRQLYFKFPDYPDDEDAG